ncbi:choline-sulfatase [Marinomonas sp. 5E14-1]|uniref:choline-sulfatase n=1 Tax=Marinomonas sp. 5E14-1 TaxID=3153922 RepID=UPI0032662328
MGKKPNIVLIMADQLGAKFLPAYGHKVVKTPNIDRLAEKGVVFKNAYCASPLCGPSRMSMMTGLLPSAVGAFDNASELPASQPTFVHYMRRQGYKTCLSGKMHFAGPDQLHGYEKRVTTDIYPTDFGWTANWYDHEAKVRFQDMTNVLNVGPCTRSMQIDYDDEVAYRGIKQIYDFAREKDDNPFFLTISFTNPHDPYTPLEKYWNLYNDAEIDLPEVPFIPLEDRDSHSKRLYYHYSTDEANLNEADIRQMRHGYYGSISYIDDKVGDIMSALESSGQLEDTIVIFTADHGDMAGERGMWYKKNFFDHSLQVPFIVTAPKIFSAKYVDNVVSHLDFLPTFAAMSGCSDDEILETNGSNLMGLLSGEGDLEDRPVRAEYLAEGVFDPVFMIRSSKYKFIYSKDDISTLYDMENDPKERYDLSLSEEHKELIAEYKKDADSYWDNEALKQKIILDQQRRKLVFEAQKQGEFPKWDYQPFEDASKQYVRAGIWTTVAEAAAYLAPQNPVEK